jgi:xylulose-5-phosphate/fructose-6-phosphate phosphoketolase
MPSEIDCWGPARATIPGAPLGAAELHSIHAYWRACNYLAAGMIYLRANPLLREPLRAEHVKKRLLGHWGSSPGLSFCYTHFNRIIRQRGEEVIFLAGPGHGAPGVIAPVYLVGAYSEVYPGCGQDIRGMEQLFRSFSFPGGVGSHCTPELPGSIHEGGELGYSLSHGTGAVLDNPRLVAAVVIGDGEAETGPLAASWNGGRFLNPATDGAILPILHLNGYKINNPTVLARIPRAELVSFFSGLGYEPLLVEGSEAESMHQAMAATLDAAFDRIDSIRTARKPERARWPLVILRSPKGWTGPGSVDGTPVEGTFRSHQVPLAGLTENPAHLAQLEAWLAGYRPGELFDESGTLLPELRVLAPSGAARMSARPEANGGLLRRPLRLGDHRVHAVAVEAPGATRAMNTAPLGRWLRDIMRDNPGAFRVFGPDETASNKLHALFEVTGKTWLAERLPCDDQGGHLAPDGRVMEILSEHTLEGWLEGYLLTGRHGLLSTYEAFVHVIDSMVNQHAKWLAKSRELPWRASVASLNLLITSTVWRQDHNGFTHQDPGFIDLVANKSPEVTRVYLPPDANCLLAVANHCLASVDYVNVIVCDKQDHPQFLTAEQAERHCAKGLGLWEWASTDMGLEPDAVLAGCGDIATQEALAAAKIIRQHLPELRLRFVNVVDLFRLAPEADHPHGLPDREFDTLFTTDKPVIFNFHGYPYMIHRLAYRRANHGNFHVRGYRERGNINTPLELAISNRIDRFTLARDVIGRVPRFRVSAAHLREKLLDEQLDCLRHAHEHGVDREDIVNWRWTT